jgi:Ca2+-binding RTX toxin-like protein
MRARVPLIVAVAVFAGVAAAPDAALSASVVHPGGAARLDFRASPGEANRLTVTSGVGGLTVTDRGVSGVDASQSDCTLAPEDDQTVVCPAAGITTLELSGGDLDDELINETTLPAQAYGEAGADTVRGGDANERLEGGPGADLVLGGGGDDRLYGETLQEPGAGADADQLSGGAGDDQLFGSGGGDLLDGGSGADQLEGAGGADDLRGDDGPDRLIGGDGDDHEDGGAGDDAMGTDTTLGVGELAPDSGNDVLDGGAGDDSFVPGLGSPLADADTVNGGGGHDWVTYGIRMESLSITKDGVADDGGLGEHDNVASDVERITGGLASDALRGGSGADELEGGPGDDRLDGLDGDDILRGDAGPGSGEDVITGGPGADVVEGELGGDMLSGDAGTDTVDGGAGADTLSGGPDADRLRGGPQRDKVVYSTAADVTVRLDAGTGGSSQPGDDDVIAGVEDVGGGAQRDTLTGTREANSLSGGQGEDYVEGGRGVDQLDGGRGADVVAARDGARDKPVSCGPGRDAAITDRRDPVVLRGRNRCEHVFRAGSTKPRGGWVYVHPQRCAKRTQDVGFRLPAMHRLVPLRYDVLLPSGWRRRPAPLLDTGDCKLRLRATPGRGPIASAEISGGTVAVGQTPGRAVTTLLTIRRPACATRALSARARDPRLRVASGRRRGRWRVRGKYSIGSSVGTDWTTIAGCSSTTTVVRRGRVRVYDRVRRRTVVVRAGHRYVARARASGSPRAELAPLPVRNRSTVSAYAARP